MTQTISEDSCSLEVELKFEFTRQDLRKLSRSSAFKALQIETPVKRTMRAIYYDTPDLSLFKRELSLRVRKESRKYVQCCKSKAVAHNASVDTFSRQEWQWKLKKKDLDIKLIDKDKELCQLFKGIDLATLEPLFSTTIKRQTRLLETSGGAKVRCDIDQGVIESGENKSKIFELELELESGPVNELLELACLVTSIVPARISSRTKALKGYNLFLDGTLKNWVKAQPLNFLPSATAEQVLNLSLVENLKHLISNEDCVLEQSHIEGVHQMRVALRRMRAILSSFSGALPKAPTAILSSAFKEVGENLSLARDYDVFLSEILLQAEMAMGSDHRFKILRKLAEQQQILAYDKAQKTIQSPLYATLLTNLLHWIGSTPWVTENSNPLAVPAHDFAFNLLEKRHLDLIHQGQKLVEMSESQRHLLRISIKKMRYTADAFSPLYSHKKHQEYLGMLRELQDRLGGLNDLTMSKRIFEHLKKEAQGDKKDIVQVSKLIKKWHKQTRQTDEPGLLKAWSVFLNGQKFWTEHGL